MGIVVNRTRLNPFPVKSASGEFISIDDAVNRPVKKLEISFTPQQDLHGYSYPWAERCGKNLIDVYIAPDRIDVPHRGLTLTYVTDSDGNKLGVSYVGTLTQKGGISPSYGFIPSSDGDYICGLKVFSGSTTGIIYFFVYDVTASKDMQVHWTDPNQYATVHLTAGHRYVVGPNFEPVGSNINIQLGAYVLPSNATTIEWSPYSNICPISGYEGLNFNLSSPNLYDGVWEYGNISETTGQNSGNSHSFFRSKNYLPIPYGQKLYYYSPFRSGAFRQFFYDENYNFLWRNGETWNTVSGVKNAVYMRFRVSGTYTEEQDSKISMNVPSTDHAFVEHHGETIPVSWQTEAGTVMGGTLDLVHGVLTANIVSVTTNDDNVFLSSAMQRNTHGTLFDVHVDVSPKHGLPIFEISNIFTAGTHSYLNVNSNEFYSVWQNDTNVDCMRICWGKPQGASTLTEFKTFLQNNPAQFAYEIETPITYQLTPHQISTLMGSNRIWTDVGTISLDYRAMRSAQNTPLLGMLGNPSVPEEPIEEVEE